MKKVRYAVVGAGWISQEAFMPAVAQTGNSETVAIVIGNADVGPVPVSFWSFESDTRHRGDWIWQQYTATSSSGMRFALRSPVA
jgi:hypothetical protein